MVERRKMEKRSELPSKRLTGMKKAATQPAARSPTHAMRPARGGCVGDQPLHCAWTCGDGICLAVAAVRVPTSDDSTHRHIPVFPE
ncbi:hypothetical protein ACP70R_048000 [Stipagrostis hirtigluma subsp. patula]